jgi:hypothetical protein
MASDLRLQLAEDGADGQRLAELVGNSRAELLQFDVDDVTVPEAGSLPLGARGFSVVSVGALMVALGQSADGLRAVVSAVREWLRRGGAAIAPLVVSE